MTSASSTTTAGIFAARTPADLGRRTLRSSSADSDERSSAAYLGQSRGTSPATELVGRAFREGFGNRTSYSSSSSRSWLPRCLVVFVLALTAWAVDAPAQELETDAETRTAARELARQGADAYESGDNETALDRLDRAYALVPAPSISVMQARVLVRLGRWVEALDRYENTRVAPLGPTAPEAFRNAVADATTEGEALRARIPLLAIHVRTADGSLEGLAVSLDGKPVPPELLDVERPIDPGSHEVAAAAPGYQSVRRVISLTEGDRIPLEIQLRSPPKPVARAAPKPTEAPIAAPPAASRRDRIRTRTQEVVGWAALGIGTAAVVTGTVAGLIALGKKSYLDDVCGPSGSKCPPGSEDEIDSYHLTVPISYVAFAVGAASLGVGGYLLLSGTRESSNIAAEVGTDRIGLSGRF